jgi:hypothetical protein
VRKWWKFMPSWSHPAFHDIGSNRGWGRYDAARLPGH